MKIKFTLWEVGSIISYEELRMSRLFNVPIVKEHSKRRVLWFFNKAFYIPISKWESITTKEGGE